jgi:hypothetical protein
VNRGVGRKREKGVNEEENERERRYTKAEMDFFCMNLFTYFFWNCVVD